jgi:hypothetical protein
MNTPDEYTVRRLTPADADGVAALVRHVYGNHYSYHAEIYDPRQIVSMNATGELVSVVAVEPGGTVVGHCAIVRQELGPIAETGEAMVAPEHRAHHLMNRMQALIHEEAARLGLAGVYGGPVTNHLFSQKVYEANGCHPCGVMLGMLPASFQNQPQRMTDMLYFKFLQAPAPAVVHLPERHRAMVELIYAQFSVSLDFRPGQPLEGEGELAAMYRSVTKSGAIRIERPGENLPGAIHRTRQALVAMGAEVIYLRLSLADAQTPELCGAVESAGFSFAGIQPLGAPDGDALWLLSLFGDFDPALVQVENPFGKELLDYVVQDRRRVGSAPA